MKKYKTNIMVLMVTKNKMNIFLQTLILTFFQTMSIFKDITTKKSSQFFFVEMC
jgi:hypothetical protein